MYFASAGASGGKLGGISQYGTLFSWCAILYATHFGFIVITGGLMALDWKDILVASNANVGE